MREHGLSPKQRSRYVTTTDSDHDEPILTWRPTRGRERGRCRLNLAQLRNNLSALPVQRPPEPSRIASLTNGLPSRTMSALG